MHSYLLLNTLGAPATECSWWSFSGAEDSALRDCLEQLDEFVVTNPSGRWSSPVVFGMVGAGRRFGTLPEPITFENAWTAKGARRLADLLPDAFSDVREDILNRFPSGERQ
jgi:hypothetical protein